MASNNIVKADAIFTGPEHGWTETWYFLNTDTSLNTAANRFFPYVSARLGILSSQNSIKAQRFSFVTGPTGLPVLGDSFITSFNAVQAGAIVSAAGSVDLNVAFILRGSDALFLNHRNIFIRGFPDEQEDNAGNYNGGPNGFASRLASFKNAMLTTPLAPIGWLHNTRSTPVNVVSVVQNNGNPLITLSDDTFVVGPSGQYEKQTVRLYTARQPNSMTGQLIVIPTGARTCITFDRIPILPTVPIGWTLSTYSFDFKPIAAINNRQMGRRPVGRPLEVSPGKQRGRVLTSS